MTNLINRNDKFVTVHNKCSKIPPPPSKYLATPVQRSNSNSSISVTIQNQSHVHTNFLFPQLPILSPPTVLNFPPHHPVFMSIVETKFSTNNSSASPVFFVHVSIALSYHSSHNVLFTFLINITHLLNYINHPNFSILSASNNSIKVKVTFSLYKP